MLAQSPTKGHAMPDAVPLAYSYVRFSHPSQSKGDSLRRQMEAAADWCARNAARLDVSTTLHDLGRSAFTGKHRENADRHALAGFLRLVEAGKVPRGSYLIIENLDRLSREHIQPALLLALGLLQAGIRIVQLKPVEMVFDDRSDTMPVMMMMMELSRGHGESRIKSERCGAAWQQKRVRARGEGHIMTRRLPAWVRASAGGSLELVPERAAAVRRIYALARDGYGLSAIVRRLVQDTVPPFGDGEHWARSYVGLILRDRRAVGEFQPRDTAGEPSGDPIPRYYPAVVTEAEWHAARAGADSRRQRRGQLGVNLNVFAGLLRNARDGDTYFAGKRVDHGRSHVVLINSASAAGRASCWSFPYEVFETAVLSQLCEVDPGEILGERDGVDETVSLAGQLVELDRRIAELERELIRGGKVAAVSRVLRQLEGDKETVTQQMANARAKAAHPLGDAWSNARSILDTLRDAADPEDVRLRLRAALRRIVDSVWLLVVPKGRRRLCAVQVWFTGGEEYRTYLIAHRPAMSNGIARVEGAWNVRGVNTLFPAGLWDFRDAADAADSLKVFERIKPEDCD